MIRRLTRIELQGYKTFAANTNIELPEMYSKLFTMSRIYNMKYDLTRSVKLNFSARRIIKFSF